MPELADQSLPPSARALWARVRKRYLLRQSVLVSACTLLALALISTLFNQLMDLSATRTLWLSLAVAPGLSFLLWKCFARLAPSPTQHDALLLAEHLGDGVGAVPLLDASAVSAWPPEFGEAIRAQAERTLIQAEQSELAPILSARIAAAASAGLVAAGLSVGLMLANVSSSGAVNQPPPVAEGERSTRTLEVQQSQPRQHVLEDLRRRMMVASAEEARSAQAAFEAASAKQQAAVEQAEQELEVAREALAQGDAERAQAALDSSRKALQSLRDKEPSAPAGKDQADPAIPDAATTNPAGTPDSEADALKRELERAVKEEALALAQIKQELSALKARFAFDPDATLVEIERSAQASQPASELGGALSAAQAGSLEISADAWQVSSTLKRASASGVAARRAQVAHSYLDALKGE